MAPLHDRRRRGGWDRVGPGPHRTRVNLVTEGTYPFVTGGVSTWCHQLLLGIDDVEWSVVAITAGDVGPQRFELPPHATLGRRLHVWGASGDERPADRRPTRAPAADRPGLAAGLVRGLLGWEADPLGAAEELVWCRRHGDDVTDVFRTRGCFDAYVEALTSVLEEQHDDIGAVPAFDLASAVDLYHTLYWLARTAALPSPTADVGLVTAAGWAAVPAVVDKAMRGTPFALAEHGVYVREAYLAAARSADPPSGRFLTTRLARGLARMAYAAADAICPVTSAHVGWETALGADPARIHPIPNGVPTPGEVTVPPGTRTVVSVGRVDPLKDVMTMVRVADAVRARVPDVTFRHYGPVAPAQAGYAERARALHAELGLGDAFTFMGATDDPTGVMRDADVVLMTSISEGFPMAVLEALSQARPVVTTAVGGVLEAMEGAGLSAPAGDVDGLADAVVTLLRRPELAHELGVSGRARVERRFGLDRCIGSWSTALHALAGQPALVDAGA